MDTEKLPHQNEDDRTNTHRAVGQHAKQLKSSFTRPADMRFNDGVQLHRRIRILIDVLYVLGFIAASLYCLYMLQWGVAVNPDYSLRQVIRLVTPGIIGTSPTHQPFIFLLNLILIQLVYLFLTFLCNSLWTGTGIIVGLGTILAVAERIKSELRGEPILSSDLVLAAGNTQSVTSFIPSSSYRMIIKTIIGVVILIALCILGAWFFGKARPVRFSDIRKRIAAQLIGILTPALVLGCFVAGTSSSTSWGRVLATRMGDMPRLWNSLQDAQDNGTLYTFIRNSFTTVMDRPADYSEKTMQDIEKRYRSEAASINASRQNKMTDSTVVMVLSESFSDPTRVPGLSFSSDPMPEMRKMLSTTTSGLFLSSGYGGGTANLEYQSLTGLSTVNFSPSLTSPYQQLVPRQKAPFTFNQMWDTDQAAGSVAFHPFSGGTYQRRTNYKKFRFQHFWTLDGPEVIKYKGHVDYWPWVDDSDAYKNVVDYLQRDKQQKQSFIQLVTMQNHMPYTKNLFNNTITEHDSIGKGREQKDAIETYAQGVRYTDKATAEFLSQLDQLSRPVTVIWYGDHLPGIYDPQMASPDNLLTLHETDYFIWSNKASGRQGTKISDRAYTSPNFLMAQGADYMDAKVSPYLAFLTRLHEQIPAMEPLESSRESQDTTDWVFSHGSATYLTDSGKRITTLSSEQRRLLRDYRLIQYDMTVGRGYLARDGFLTAPIK